MSAVKRQLRNVSLQKLDDSEKCKLSKGEEGGHTRVGSVVKRLTIIKENCSCCDCDVTPGQTVSFDDLLVNCMALLFSTAVIILSLITDGGCEYNNILHIVIRSIHLLPSEDKPVNTTHLSSFSLFQSAGNKMYGRFMMIN